MIHVVGISHRLTPLQRREMIALAADALPRALARTRQCLNADECVILSTCNRTELYLTGAQASLGAALESLVPDERARASLRQDEVYTLSGEQAAVHLCEVASGMDSPILGEHEILAQVKAAFQAAQDAGCVGRLLTRLFVHALRAGKRARAETRIASGVFSVGHCAARAAAEVLGGLDGRSLLVVGAGRMAEATAKHLAQQGIAQVTVANRTQARAWELARRLGGRAHGIVDLPDLLADADVVITCVSAPHFVLDRPTVERVVPERGGRALVIIDVSVPRSVDPTAGAVDGVRLFNLDELEPLVAENARSREGEVTATRAIVAQEVQAFERWREQAGVGPLIQDLRRWGEAVRQECLEQAQGKLRHLSARDMETVGRVTDLVVKRLLHGPTKALRVHPNGDPFTIAGAVQEMFNLSPDIAHADASSDAADPLSGRVRSEPVPAGSRGGDAR